MMRSPFTYKQSPAYRRCEESELADVREEARRAYPVMLELIRRKQTGAARAIRQLLDLRGNGETT